jgi:hypothetical protein
VNCELLVGVGSDCQSTSVHNLIITSPIYLFFSLACMLICYSTLPSIGHIALPTSHTNQPTSPHPSFPTCFVLWRSGYECELAIVLTEGFGSGTGSGGGISVRLGLLISLVDCELNCCC